MHHISSSVQQLKDIWVVSIFYLLWISNMKNDCSICRGMIWLSHNSRFILRFLIILHTDFGSDWTSLQFHEHLMRVHFSQHSLQCLSLVLLIFVILDGVRWNLKAVLICISSTAREDEKLNYLLVIFYFFFLELAVQIPSLFLNGSVLVLTLLFEFLYILDMNPLWDGQLAKILLFCGLVIHSIDCLFSSADTF